MAFFLNMFVLLDGFSVFINIQMEGLYKVSVLPTPSSLLVTCVVILRQQFFDFFDRVVFDFRKHLGKPLYGFYVV